MRERIEGKIGRAALTIAQVAATALLVLAVAAFIGLTIRRHFRGEPDVSSQTPHAAGSNEGRPSESNREH